MSVTWNPSDKDSNITLSNQNLSAANALSSWRSVRGTSSYSTGKYYVENIGELIGWGNSSASLASYGGSDNNGWAVTNIGQVYRNASVITNWDASDPNKQIRCIAYDIGGKLCWGKTIDGTSSGTWKGASSSSGDPGAGTNGQSVSALAAGNALPFLSINSSASKTFTNFGQIPFFGTVPSGFSGPDPAYPVTYTAGVTTFDVASSSSGVTLTQNSLRAQLNTSANQYQCAVVNNVLPVGSAALFQVLVSAWASDPSTGGYRIGLISTAESVTSSFSSAAVNSLGQISINGVHVATVSALAFTVGCTIEVFANLNSGVKKIWFGKNGVWDGNPSAGTGGYDISSITPSLSLKAAVAFTGLGTQTLFAADARFGSMSWWNGVTVPTGGSSYDTAVGTIASGDGAAAGTGNAAGVGGGVFISVGAAAGVGSAAGVWSGISPGVGSAAGTGTALGGSYSVGAGTAAGTSTASANSTQYTLGAGFASGGGVALAYLSVVTPGAGAAAGTGGAAGVGTNANSVAGTAAGVGAATGAGAVLGYGIGSSAASGSSTASASSSLTYTGVGSSEGLGRAQSVGTGVTPAAGVTASAGAASGVSRSSFIAAGASAGTGSAAAVGAGLQDGAGSAAGIGAVSGVGARTYSSAGAAAASGTVSGTGEAVTRVVGLAAGTSVVMSVGAATTEGAGSSSGAGSMTGVGRVIASGVGAASGSGVGAGEMTKVQLAAAVSAAVSAALAVGAYTAISPLISTRIVAVREDIRVQSLRPDEDWDTLIT